MKYFSNSYTQVSKNKNANPEINKFAKVTSEKV